MPSTTRSTPQSGRRVRGWLAWILVVVGSVVFFVPLAVFWAMVLFDATLMGQCGYEEVRCPGAGEFLADYGLIGFVPLLVVAATAAYGIVAGRIRAEERAGRAQPS